MAFEGSHLLSDVDLQGLGPSARNKSPAVKELQLGYHNTEMYQTVWFLNYDNLI